MANLTIKIDDEALKKAWMRALAEGTSVNSLLKAYIERFCFYGEKDCSVVKLFMNLESG